MGRLDPPMRPYYRPAMKNRIREHRTARKLTLEQLADMVGTTKGHLSSIETGKREPSIPMLRAIAQALKVSDTAIFAPSSPEDARLLDFMHDFSRLSPDDQAAVSRIAKSLLPRDES